jgi:hypothetical protein
MADVVKFPGAPSDRELNDDGDRPHAEAFRDLEPEVCCLERMGDIAQDLIMQCAAREDSLRKLELAAFAVSQLSGRFITNATAVSWCACHEAPAPIALEMNRPPGSPPGGFLCLCPGAPPAPQRVLLERPLCAAKCRSSNAVLCGAGSLAGNQRWSKALNPKRVMSRE